MHKPKPTPRPASVARRAGGRRGAILTAAAVSVTGLFLGAYPASADIGDAECNVPNPPIACDVGTEPTTSPAPAPPAPAPPAPPTVPPPPPAPPSDIYVHAGNGVSDAFIPAGTQPKVAVPDTNGAFVSASAVSTTSPFSPVVKLRWDPPGPNNSSSCTGVLIGPHTVATAAHCVWDNGSYKAGGTADGAAIAAVWAPYEYRHFSNSDGSSTPLESHFDYAAVTLASDLGNTRGWMSMEIHPSFEPGGPIMLLSIWQACKDAEGMPGLRFATRSAAGSYNIEFAAQVPKGCSGGPVVDRYGGEVIGITSASDAAGTTSHHMRRQSVEDLLAVRNGSPRPDPTPTQGGGGTTCEPSERNDFCMSGPIVVQPPEM